MLRWEESTLVMGKIEALDIKGALRLASSSDSFAKATPWVKIMFTLWATQENVAKREAKHPPRPTDYFFQPPSTDITFPQQQLIAKLLVKNVKSFPNDSARGVSNLRPQHLKDLTNAVFPKTFRRDPKFDVWSSSIGTQFDRRIVLKTVLVHIRDI